jgi:hypothetical protein
LFGGINRHANNSYICYTGNRKYNLHMQINDERRQLFFFNSVIELNDIIDTGAHLKS